MAEKIYVGVNSKNIFNGKRTTSGTHIGVTYSYDAGNQEYTLNGTATGRGDLLLESGLPIDWEIGEYYTVTIIQTGGTAVIGDGEGITYSFSIFSMNNTKYIRDGNLSVMDFPGTRSFTAKAFEEVGGAGYKFYLQLWRVGTVFDNYKFKVQIEKGSQATDYVPYFRNVAKEAKKIYFSKEGVARLAEKAYTSVNGIARLLYSIKENSGVVPDSAILLFPFDVDGYDVIVGSKKITYTSLSSEVAKFGKAAYRDSGYDTYLSVSDLSGKYLHLSQISGGTKNLTLESWVKITSANAIILRYGSTNETYMQGLAIYSNSTGFELKWLISANVVKSTVTANIGTTPQDNWHHLAISVNNKIASFFVDGKKYGEIDISGYNTNHNYLGIGSTKGTYYDELLVCNDSLYTSDFAPPTGPYVLK